MIFELYHDLRADIKHELTNGYGYCDYCNRNTCKQWVKENLENWKQGEGYEEVPVNTVFGDVFLCSH